MRAAGWDKKPGVRIIFGRWQDVVGRLGQYDGIFFDTYSEFYDDLRHGNASVPRKLLSIPWRLKQRRFAGSSAVTSRSS